MRTNIELVSKLELKEPFGDVAPGQIADVSIHKKAAYLASWSEPKDPVTGYCTRGGFFSVDISDPAKPKQQAFEPALPGNYHGEGMHAIEVNDARGGFDGDLLAVNNETCTPAGGEEPPRGGGIDLYDVSDPANPKVLAQAIGDYCGVGVLDEPACPNRTTIAHEVHSVFLWQDGQDVFAVLVDNLESGSTDVDIFNVSDPTKPVPVAEYSLNQRFPQIAEQGGPLGQTSFLHDMVVKEIDGVQTMLLSYWDGGYVTMNVDDPRNPVYIADSDFGPRDPANGKEPPEGNAHQAEFSRDNKYILAADEDFDDYRFVGELTGGPNAGYKFFSAAGADEGPNLSPEAPRSGDIRFIGRGCDQSFPASNGDVTIALVERGGCTFQAKTENAEARGYDTVIIFNNVVGGGQRCDELIGMDFTNYQGNAFPLFVGRSVGFRLMDAYDDSYSCVEDDPGASTPTPTAPREGSPLTLSIQYDGWGYAHVFRNGPGKFQKLGDYFVAESQDERFVADDNNPGFGTLSIHEWATDPTENLAYTAYYSAGVRVVAYGDQGIQERGRFIDEGGNDFWGVEQFTTDDGERLFAGSDRDYGLYLFRYTGPGAAAKPACTDQNVTVPHNTAITIGLTCTDANGNPLTRRLTSTPGHGAIGSVDQGAGTVSYTPSQGYSGPDSFTFTANDGAATSNQATVRITVTAGPTGCRNLITGTAARDLIAGTESSDRVNAGAGDDVVDARNGNDCLFGEAGGDVLDGEGGNDVVEGSTGPDRLIGGTGADLLTGGEGVDRIAGDAGNDRVSGGANRDILAGGGGADALYGGTGKDTISGGTGNDRISGGSSADRIYGNAGSDRITPGTGADRVIAAGGNDRISARDRTKDRISCGSGRDQVTADRIDVLTNCERVSRR